jgi:phosphoenolpyruvate carboxylase
MARKPKIERFEESVRSKFQIYNNLLLTLPFEGIQDTGVLLPLFAEHCRKCYQEDYIPQQIIASFFERYCPEFSLEEQNNQLFKFIQYIERQVVLFDAIEDAAFSYVNNMHGRGTIRAIKEEARDRNKSLELQEYLKRFKVRIVLTAHPTQFYPDSVLGIINDLAVAVASNDLMTIKTLLTQLGKTRFYKKEKPTPYDEAVSLIWYLENVFYHSASTIYNYVKKHIFEGQDFDHSLFDFGFWPGGDRDGNPFVTAETTLKTSQQLRFSILRNYYRDLRKLKRKLTFDHVDTIIQDLTNQVFDALIDESENNKVNAAELKTTLTKVRDLLIAKHQSLYIDEVNDLLHKIQLFGTHFACLDIRQDSRIHAQVFADILKLPKIADASGLKHKDYLNLKETERYQFLSQLSGLVTPDDLASDTIARSTIESIYAIRQIQERNGELGCNRYIISNCQSVQNVLELFAMCRLTGWERPNIDIIPLFETVPDLEAAESVMRVLFENPTYRKHLEHRGNKQTIMLGFSDGTKDGGYFMANWSIYKCKEVLSSLCTQYGLSVAFFDGRGGPPARGGGNTHQFYAAMGSQIKVDDIQLTVQGQTISSNFGTLDSSQYNLEQLLSSGIERQVFLTDKNDLTPQERTIMEMIAKESHKAYTAFKAHPKFVSYLQEMTTLPYYAKTNIGSRPAKRGNKTTFSFEDLRAIPFVGSWSQSKQNVPGFYGFGTALQCIKEQGDFETVKALYHKSRLFRTLVANSMMSLTKSFFKLTEYIKDDPDYGDFWQLIFEEYTRTHTLILELTNFTELMQNEPTGKASIQLREDIVQPLLTIQQYALIHLRALRKDQKQKGLQEQYEKMVTRSMFGNINASRNSA